MCRIIKLNLGSGPVAKTIFAAHDWVNVDKAWSSDDKGWPIGGEYMNFDITEEWPLEDESVECIFASHVFEHIRYDQLLLTLSECCRVLKSGHPLRIVCPDPRAFIENWRNKNFQFVHDSYDEDFIEKWDYENNPHLAYTDMFFPEAISPHVLVCCPDLLTVFMIRAGFPIVSEMKNTSTRFQQYFGKWVVRNDDPPNTTIDNRPAMSFYLEVIK